jgi:phage terminase small subunit
LIIFNREHIKMPMKSKRKLTAKQERFIKEYLVDLDATKAAKRAGYSKKTAGRIGHETLKKLENEIQAEIDKRNNRIELTADRVLREVCRLALFDPRKLYDENGNLKPIHELDDDTAAAICGVEVFEEFSGKGKSRIHVGMTRKIKLHRKDAAQDKLMRHLGLFEKDNAQTADALTSLLDRIAGSGVPGPAGANES